MKLYKKPTALTSTGWSEWEQETRKRYPIQFFFRETVVDELYVWQRRLRDIKWWVFHRFHPKHRYHVIKPRTLTPGYADPDIQMVHACFDLLSQYVEKRVIDGKGVTPQDIREAESGEAEWLIAQRKWEQEAWQIWMWWLGYLKKDDIWEQVPDLTPEEHKTYRRLKDNQEPLPPSLADYEQAIIRVGEIEQKWEDELTEYFHRLVDIHRHLWY